MYLLKLGINSWKSEPLLQLITALSGSTLALGAYVLLYFSGQLGNRVRVIENTRTVTAYLAPGAKSEIVVDALRTSVGAAPDRVEVREAQEVLGELEKQDPELARQLAGLGRDLGQIVPRYVRVSGEIPRGVEAALKGVEGVDTVEVQRNPLQPLGGTLSQLRRLGLIFAALLIVAWGVGLSHLFRVTALRRESHLSLLVLWGAPAWKLSIPAVTHAAFLGMCSLVFSVGGFWAVRVLLRNLPTGVWDGWVAPPMMHAGILGGSVFLGTVVLGMLLARPWVRWSS